MASGASATGNGGEAQRRDVDGETREDARAGYAAAIELWTSSSEEQWSKFNALLVANSILIAVIGLALASSERGLPWVLLVTRTLPVLGVVLTILWASATVRGFTYLFYFVSGARWIEEQYLSPTVRTLSQGAVLPRGREVPLVFDTETKVFRMNRFARLVPARWSMYLTIGIFAALYVVLFVATFV